jgi:predicted choloylglycine hydrolase
MEQTEFAGHPPLMLSGSPFARGVAQASDPRITVDQVVRATIVQVDQAIEGGLIDAEARVYLQEQETFSRLHAPACIDEIEGIAKGFGLSFNQLFTYLHLGTLRDMRNSLPTSQDGCSAWATFNSEVGSVVVKNRDFSGPHVEVQRLTIHSGPDLAYGPIICLGSLGSPGAYSSGMNSAGLAIADTQIGCTSHAVGWLRYFLMTHLLRSCQTVEDALVFIESVPHARGGSLVLADAHLTAAVELGVEVVVTRARSWVARTNHFLSPSLKGTTLLRSGYGIDTNSQQRLDCLKTEIPVFDGSVGMIKSLMARHADDYPSGAPMCQHPGSEGSRTLSSVIFECQSGLVHYHEGNPCLGQWQALDLTAYNV